jgi:hypothetical protein
MKNIEPLPIIPNRHYAQSSLARRRREQRIERRRRGEAGFPVKAWKKGRGKANQTWSPFDEDGRIRESVTQVVQPNGLRGDGFVHVGAFIEPEIT